MAQVQSTREEVETLRSNKYELLTTMDGLKKAMDNKEEQIRDLLAVKSALEQQRVAPPRPSDREADLLTRLQAEEDRVKELTRQLNSAEDRERRLEVENVHLKRDARKVDLQSPTSPTAPVNSAPVSARPLGVCLPPVYLVCHPGKPSPDQADEPALGPDGGSEEEREGAGAGVCTSPPGSGRGVQGDELEQGACHGKLRQCPIGVPPFTGALVNWPLSAGAAAAVGC